MPEFKRNLLYGIVFAVAIFGMIFTMDAAAVIAVGPVETSTTNRQADTVKSGLSIDPTDIEHVRDWLDKNVNDQLRDFQIPGATVAVVADGRLVFAGGYGLADIDSPKPASAESTPFFMASVGKLFAATAVMQLVEAGEIDLNADVNVYLTRFKIPDSYPGHPVTVADLLTHTAGFEDQLYKMYATSGDKIPPLGDFLATHIPARVQIPGKVTSYSNYGYALAGYLVEVVSGEPYADYVVNHIFKPLGMNLSTVAQPTPANIKDKIADTYRVSNGNQVKAPVQYGFEAPAGDGNAATAVDMAKFMLAHLQNGELDGQRILDVSTAKLMQNTAFRNDPRVPGMTYGFEQGMENGWNTLSKAGDVIGAHADLVLVPDAAIGIYVAYNGEGIGGGAMLAAKQLTQRFINDFLPPRDDLANVPEVESIPITAEKFAGNYSSIQFSRTTFTKMSTLFQSVTVIAEPDGTLTTEGLSADPASVPRHWIQFGDNLFRERDGQQTIAFGLDNNGNAVSLYASEDPSIAFERLTWYELPMLYMALCGIPLLLLIFNAVLWPVAALARRFRRQPSGQNRAALIARWLVWSTGILLILFLIGFYLMIKDFNVFLETVTVGTSPLLKFTLLMPTLAAATTAAAIVYNVSAWLKHWWNKRTRVYYTAVTVCAVVFMLAAANYRLVGWPLF